jgi:hypothetical protein
MPVDWAAIAWKLAPLAADQASKWWQQSRPTNLSRRVIKLIDSRDTWPPGIREELVEQWLYVRDDRFVATLVRHLLEDPDPALEPLLEQRVAEVLGELPLKLGAEETARRLAWAVLDQLGPAQTKGDRSHADHRRTHRQLGGVLEQLQHLNDNSDALRLAAERPGSVEQPAPAAAVFLGDFDGDQQWILDELRRSSPQLAVRLAQVLAAKGPDGLEELVRVPPSWAEDAPAELWRALNALANAAGRFGAARRAAEIEADAPEADRADALVRAARSAYAAEEDAIGGKLSRAAEALEADHPSVLLLAASRAHGHAERLALAERAEPRTDRQRAWKEAELAFALLGLNRLEEAATAAAESVKLNPHGVGPEAQFVVRVLQAAMAFPEEVVPPRALADAAEWFMHLAKRNREQGRKDFAGLATSRAALALAVAGDRKQVISLIDDSLDRAETGLSEAAWNFSDAALIAGDPARALSVLPAPDSEEARLHAAITAIQAGSEMDSAIAELDELASSANPNVATNAVRARFMAAHDPAVELPEELQGRVPDGARLLAHAKAFRAAAAGHLAEAEAFVSEFDDPASLALRIELAEQAQAFARAVRLAERFLEQRDSGVHQLRLAALRARAGDLAGARHDALSVAVDANHIEALRLEAFSMAAQAANEEGNFRSLEEVASQWLDVDAATADAFWWKAYALARQRRYGEMLDMVDVSPFEIETNEQALLVAEAVTNAVANDVERLRRLCELSDSRDRPERLEYALIAAALRVPGDARPQGELEARIKQTFDEFGARFPESSLLRVVTIDEADPVGSLLEALESFGRAPADLQERIAEAEAGVKLGQSAVAVLASLAGESTVAILADGRPLPLAFTAEGARDEEKASALRAINETAASWDATAIAVASGLPGEAGRRIRGVLAASQVGQATFDEVGRADGVAASPTDPASIRGRRAEALHRAAGFAAELTLTPDAPGGPLTMDAALRDALVDRELAPPFRAFVSAVSVARTAGIPLYSDDRAARTLARGLGVDAFGTLALMDALVEQGRWTEAQASAVRNELAAYGAWGLALDVDEFIESARSRGFAWDSGVAGFFSDVLAHREPPRGLVHHAAAALRCVSGEASDLLETWARNVVNAVSAALNTDGWSTIRTLLAATFDIAGAMDARDHDAIARVIRELREVPYLRHQRVDPLVWLVNDWLTALEDEQQSALLLRLLLTQVDPEDREMLVRTFVRD